MMTNTQLKKHGVLVEPLTDMSTERLEAFLSVLIKVVCSTVLLQFVYSMTFECFSTTLCGVFVALVGLL